MNRTYTRMPNTASVLIPSYASSVIATGKTFGAGSPEEVYVCNDKRRKAPGEIKVVLASHRELQMPCQTLPVPNIISANPSPWLKSTSYNQTQFFDII